MPLFGEFIAPDKCDRYPITVVSEIHRVELGTMFLMILIKPFFCHINMLSTNYDNSFKRLLSNSFIILFFALYVFFKNKLGIYFRTEAGVGITFLFTFYKARTLVLSSTLR